jgi:hypothetical protein
MAKRRDQTTGTPRKKRQEEEEIISQGWFDDLLGNPRTRHEREDALNRLIQRGITVTGVIIAVIIAIALVVEFLIVPNQAVASVNGQNITVSEFRERVEFERARLSQEVNGIVGQLQSAGFSDQEAQQFLGQEPYSTWINEINFPDQLGRRVLDDMVDDLLVAQEAESLNVSVNDDQVQNTINDYFSYDPTQVASIGLDPTETPIPTETPTPFVSPTPSPVPTATATPIVEATAEVTAEVTVEVPELPTLAPSPTPSADDLRQRFEDNVDLFRNQITTVGDVSNAAVDAFFERRALRDVVTDVIAEGADTATFVDARHILVDTEEEALDIIAALNEGESFADLARAVSIDTGSGARGGELGMQPASNYVEPFEEATINAEIGAIVGPVQSEFGYHIIQVREREEQAVEGNQLEQQRARLFDQWLADLRTANEASIEIYDNWPDYVPRG